MEALLEQTAPNEMATVGNPANRLAWLCWGCFTVGWTMALLTPQPAELAKEMLPDEALFPSFKLAHLACYAVMTGFGLRLLTTSNGRGWLLAFLSSHAFLTEFFQQFVPGRTATFFDVGVDHLGILAGLLLSWRNWRKATR